VLTIENPQALLHVILFIIALWILATSTIKSGDSDE